MRSIINNTIIISLTLLLIYSCKPMTKESYMEDYKDFMVNLDEEHKNYKEKDWDVSDEKFKQFSQDWYQNFKSEFIWSEELELFSYKLKYKVLRRSNEGSDIVNELFSAFDSMKDELEQYKENNLQKDLEKLKEAAHEIGDEVLQSLEEALDELDENEK